MRRIPRNRIAPVSCHALAACQRHTTGCGRWYEIVSSFVLRNTCCFPDRAFRPLVNLTCGWSRRWYVHFPGLLWSCFCEDIVLQSSFPAPPSSADAGVEDSVVLTSCVDLVPRGRHYRYQASRALPKQMLVITRSASVDAGRPCLFGLLAD